MLLTFLAVRYRLGKCFSIEYLLVSVSRGGEQGYCCHAQALSILVLLDFKREGFPYVGLK